MKPVNRAVAMAAVNPSHDPDMRSQREKMKRQEYERTKEEERSHDQRFKQPAVKTQQHL